MNSDQSRAYTPEEEDRLTEAAYAEVRRAYLESNHRKHVEIIDRAYRFAREAHRGARRLSGEPYMMHPIAVARIVISEMGLGSTSICAALLHDVVEDTEFTTADIEAEFGPRIAGIVEGLTKISGGIFGDKASLQAENFRKLLLSMSTDVRVVLVKMADRLHNMRTLGSMRADKQFKIAGETLYVYAPLAHRLGLFKIKQELEDLAFRWEHPKRYAEIMTLVNESEARREAIVEQFVAPVREKLDAAGFKYEIKARVKSAYSIYKKMEAKHIPFSEIYDIYAVRVIFENDDDSLEKLRCWQIYTFFTDGHTVHPDRLRDWVSTPKANGYRALHLTVMGPEGRWIEVQIRSRKMDDIAELGYAAHWKYKSGESDDDAELDKWMNTIKDILANPEPDAIDFLDTIKLNLFSSEIFVFTPKGDLMRLPQGSTVLDLAFAIHTDLGLHCIAGKVGHDLVPLSHRLESGDQVEIITSASQKPQPEWLEMCHTAKALSRLRSELRRDKARLQVRGEAILTEFLALNNADDSPQNIARILGYYRFKTRGELTVSLACAQTHLEPAALRDQTPRPGLLRKLLRIPFAQRRRTDTAEAPDPSAIYTLDPAKSPPNYRLDSCCKPVPGDDVLGFIDDDGRIVVHKVDCPAAMRLKSAYGPRIVATRWASAAGSFAATLSVEGIDRRGILRDITEALADLGSDIRSLDIEADREVFRSTINLNVDSTGTIQAIAAALRKVKGVRSVSRTS